MDMMRPSFIDSEYFVPLPGRWELRPGAPEHIRKEFDEFMATLNIDCENRREFCIEVMDDAQEKR